MAVFSDDAVAVADNARLTAVGFGTKAVVFVAVAVVVAEVFVTVALAGRKMSSWGPSRKDQLSW